MAVKPARAEPHHFIFCSPTDPNKPRAFEETWRRVVHRAGLEDFRFHDLRHSSVTRVAESGANMLEIAAHSGHKSLKMVQRYTRLAVASRAKLVAEVFGK